MQNTFAFLAPQSFRTNLWFILVALLLTTVASCIVDDEGGPQIVSMTITPPQISRSETGTSNEFFTATIEVANFDDEITDASIYIVAPYKLAVPGKVEIEGNTIILSGIAKTWFGDLDAGVYKLGARVKSGTVPKLEENDLTTVTVTD